MCKRSHRIAQQIFQCSSAYDAKLEQILNEQLLYKRMVKRHKSYPLIVKVWNLMEKSSRILDD